MAPKTILPGILAPARKPLKTKTTTKTKTKTKTTYAEGDGGARTGLHVHILVDQSSSMGSVKKSTIDAVNEYLTTLSPEEVPTTVTLQLFSGLNGMVKPVISQRAPLSRVARLDNQNYQPQGMTPLRDAIGTSIAEVDAMRLPPSHGVVLVIQTDGQENQSREYSQEAIRMLIEQRRSQGWMVIFLAANQDAVLVGGSYGISSANSMTYNMGNEGTIMASASRSTRSYSKGLAPEAAGFTDEERTKATI